MKSAEFCTVLEQTARQLSAELGLTPTAAQEVENALSRIRAATVKSVELRAFFAGRAGAVLAGASKSPDGGIQ